MPEALNVDQLKAKALEIRKLIIQITTEAGSGHPSSSLSACDMVTALYFGGFMKYDPKQPHDPDTALFGGWRIEDMEEKLGKESGGV